mmetsp:Transcript_32794/g.50062  ORF Transcript_32794/g.50062 Transcript_32794/m.50062 type:complete len:82 (+) Transcript_32794:740-985(+)
MRNLREHANNIIERARSTRMNMEQRLSAPGGGSHTSSVHLVSSNAAHNFLGHSSETMKIKDAESLPEGTSPDRFGFKQNDE